jgi:N-methylhydantoinase B
MFRLQSGAPANPKELLFHEAYSHVETALPGGGGYGNPFERDPRAVLEDVLNGYVSIEAAEREYGVVVHSTKRPDEQVSLPRHFSIDEGATASLRAARSK